MVAEAASPMESIRAGAKHSSPSQGYPRENLDLECFGTARSIVDMDTQTA